MLLLIFAPIFQMLSHSDKLDTISTSLCTVCLTVILTGLFTELFQVRNITLLFHDRDLALQ